jgi:hypothetical protein
MKSRVLLTGLAVATMLVASSLLQPAFALTKVQANVLCVMIKFQQCSQTRFGLDHFEWCRQQGTVPALHGRLDLLLQAVEVRLHPLNAA